MHVQVVSDIVTCVVDQNGDANERARHPLDQASYGASLTPGLDPVVGEEDPVARFNRPRADTQIDGLAAPVQLYRGFGLGTGMNASRLSRKHQSDTKITSDQGSDSETASFDSYNRVDRLVSERIREGLTHGADQLGIAKGSGEISMTAGPSKCSK